MALRNQGIYFILVAAFMMPFCASGYGKGNGNVWNLLQDSIKTVIDTSNIIQGNLEFEQPVGVDSALLLTGDSVSGVSDSLKKYVPDTLVVKGGVLPLVQEKFLEKRALVNADTLPLNEVNVEKPMSAIASERSKLFKDTLSFGTVSGVSFAVPGFGQIYNKQYWKLPILYGGVAGFTTLAVHAGKQYKSYNNRYNLAIQNQAGQDEIDALHRKVNNYKTQRTLYITGAALTYLYFVGDAALNYKGVVHNTRKATVLSAIFPGAGQIYNKSYWKLPIVYGGLITFAYVIDYNNRGYQRFKKAYNTLTDGDDTTVDEFGGRYSASTIRNTRDSYRRYRDLWIIMMSAFYLLNIIDAHVDAYLRKYDVSDDLALRVEPSLQEGPVLTKRPSSNLVGMSLKLNF